MNLAGLPPGLLQARIEHGYGKSKLAMIVPMEVLTPASPSDLPPLGELVAEEPFRRYPSATMAGAGAAHLRVWLTTGAEPGHLAVVTGTGPPSCCSSTTLRPSSARAGRSSIWSGSAPMAGQRRSDLSAARTMSGVLDISSRPAPSTGIDRYAPRSHRSDHQSPDPPPGSSLTARAALAFRVRRPGQRAARPRDPTGGYGVPRSSKGEARDGQDPPATGDGVRLGYRRPR